MFLRSTTEPKYLPVFSKAITLLVRDIFKIGKALESPAALQCLVVFDRAAQSYHMQDKTQQKQFICSTWHTYKGNKLPALEADIRTFRRKGKDLSLNSSWRTGRALCKIYGFYINRFGILILSISTEIYFFCTSWNFILFTNFMFLLLQGCLFYHLFEWGFLFYNSRNKLTLQQCYKLSACKQGSAKSLLVKQIFSTKNCAKFKMDSPHILEFSQM